MATKKKMEVQVATKLTAEESKKADPAKRGVLTAGIPQSDVAGQHARDAEPTVVSCPVCGNVGVVMIHATHYDTYYCGRCGSHLRG